MNRTKWQTLLTSVNLGVYLFKMLELTASNGTNKNDINAKKLNKISLKMAPATVKIRERERERERERGDKEIRRRLPKKISSFDLFDEVVDEAGKSL